MAEGAISHLLSCFAALIRDEFNLLSGVRDEIDLIRGEFEQMNALLQVAGADEDNNPQFEAWVKQVQDTAYDAGDVLEQFTIRLKYRRSGGLSGFLRKNCNFMKTIIARHQIASEVQRIKSKVNAISQSKERYAHYMDEQGTRSNTVPTSTSYDSRKDALLLRESEIVGITKPKSDLIEWLMDEKCHELKMISVCGMGGLGKTTLVKKVFDDAEMKKYFESHLWITVSKSFRIEELLNRMIQELYTEVKKQVPDAVKKMDQIKLKEFISSFLEGKRYVIVLDDVWSTDAWDAIRYAFPPNNCSSRVILTTRDTYVASIGKVYPLLPLPEKESWTLFCRKAFQGQSCPPSLEGTTKTILRKCGGLPLAIVAIGGLLSRKDQRIDEWNKIYRGLGAELGKEGKLSNLDKVLSLSYFDLPWYLKLCFLYLSIFREDYMIDHWRLIRLWIAEGFVQSTPGLTAEEVAGSYLTELFNRSLILVANLREDGRVKEYHVHDIWRELILSRSIKQDLVTISGTQQDSIPQKVRRLSIHNRRGNCEDIKHYTTHVHSLLMFGSIESVATTSIMDFLGDGARLLKVLDVRNSSLAKFPRQIGKLLHLTYLSLRGTDVEEIPKSIGDLQMLETLDLKRTRVRTLPDEILKLHRLRHLLVYFYNRSLDGIFSFHNHFGFKVLKGIEKLSCLQKLCSIELNVNDNDVILRGLAKLTQLRRIHILFLRSRDAKELCLTLEKLIELRSLNISAVDEDEMLDLEPLSSPPEFLHTLVIKARMDKLPQWIPCLHNLTKLILHHSHLNEDPILQLQDIPNLTYLNLLNAYTGEALSFKAGTFQQLTNLILSGLQGLERVIVGEGAMPRLKWLFIGDCPLMKELPYGIETLFCLAMFQLYKISDDFISKLNRDVENENGRKIAHITKVSEISIGTKCGISGHNSRTCGKPPKVRKQGRGIRQSRTRVRGANELIDDSDSEDDDEGQTAAKTTEAQTATESVGEAELREDGFVETEGFEEPIVNENIAEEEEEFWDTVAHSADDLWNMKSKRQYEGMSQTSRVVCSQPEKVGSAKRNINKTVRRSTRILNSPKTGPTIVEFEDLTKGKEKESESLHVGILNRLAKGPRLPKGHIFKGGKRYTTLTALKADMEFKKKNCEKDGNGQV